MSKKIEKTIHVTVDIDDALYDLTPEQRKEVVTELMDEGAMTPSELMRYVKDNISDETILEEFSDNQLRTYMENERGFVCRLA